jgi:hypothetical protein
MKILQNDTDLTYSNIDELNGISMEIIELCNKHEMTKTQRIAVMSQAIVFDVRDNMSKIIKSKNDEEVVYYLLYKNIVLSVCTEIIRQLIVSDEVLESVDMMKALIENQMQQSENM